MSRWDVEALIREHLRRHPGFGAEDLAKLLFQGVMGMDHLLADRERFLAELGREWEDLAAVPLPGEVLLERVHPVAPVARLNLRPAKGAGARLAELGALFVHQPLKRGDPAELFSLWGAAMELARAGKIPFSVGELASLEEELRAGWSPAHSGGYRQRNRPAYRLIHDVTRPEAQRFLLAVGPPQGR